MSTKILLFVKRWKFILKSVGDKLRDYLGQLSCKIIKTVLSLSTTPGEPVYTNEKGIGDVFDISVRIIMMEYVVWTMVE